LVSDPTTLLTISINAKADIQYGMDNTLKDTLKEFSILGNANVFNFVLQAASVTW
jgi:hypothetical protein